jgi:NAD(P)-dependent dehydrogenase (short-subunit alcohol dehydrogenase family)
LKGKKTSLQNLVFVTLEGDMKYLFTWFFSLFLTCQTFSAQKVVLISGSTGGIGFATAKAFEQNGWKVCAGHRHNIPQELKDQNNIHLISLDVTDEGSIKQAVHQIQLKDGRIDVLINNAGYGIIGAEECVSIEEAQRLFDVNFFGCLRLIQAVAPLMRAQQSGHIINISSTSGIRAVPGLGLYAASKFALEGMSESLAVTLSPWNIHVSIVEPGTVRNEWTAHCTKSPHHEEELYNQLTQALSSKLLALSQSGQSCEEIASLIVEIAETKNPQMRYQTSQKVRETVSKKLIDPAGNAMRNEQIQFFKLLIE